MKLQNGNLFRIYSLVDKTFQDTKTLDDAKVIAKWNFLKGYEIVGVIGTIIERWQHFCPGCKKCETCDHLASEHNSDNDTECKQLKCKCKILVIDTAKYIREL